jgi:copper chaperone CopZ
MKTLKIFSLFTFLLMAQLSFAQNTTTETIPVSGNCGMCKSNIEKAAKKAGASKADWDIDAKELKVTYSSSSTSSAKIQQAIAAVGYDTRDFKTTDQAYNKLHGCCKYERADSTKLSCCEGKCDMKDGKCTDTTACKGADCCKNGTCGKKS